MNSHGFIHVLKFIFPWILIFTLTPNLRSANGECLYKHAAYNNQSVWQPDPCTVCTCQDPVPMCELITCVDPKCNHSYGEKLELSQGQCCPTCSPEKKPCQFRGQSVQHQTAWNTSACQTCQCLDGQVVCTNQSVPNIPCHPGEVQPLLPGQCSPRCIPVGSPCIHDDGVRRADGSEWFPLPCVKCVCRDGHSRCMPMNCPSVICPEPTKSIYLEGQCCPVCNITTTCHQGGLDFRDGDSWNQDDCTACVCRSGQIMCDRLICEKHERRCPRGKMLRVREGQCCPECIRTRGACQLDDSSIRYHGDMWKTGSCEYCSCRRGVVSCRRSQCRAIVCKHGKVKITHPDQCCPVCVTPVTCKVKGHLYQNAQTWDPDSCSTCECRDGQVLCYKKVCPVCQPGTAAATSQTGKCCGQCIPVRCEPDCASCNPSSPIVCTSCKAKDKLVQNGRCVDVCSEGFYPDVNSMCKKCHETCVDCFDKSDIHCLNCAPNHFMRDDRCVQQCGDGYFKSGASCFPCHSSCASCVGRRVDQCVDCIIPGQVLLRGKCIDTCSQEHYVEGNKCRKCPNDCQSCLHDGSECTSCSQGLHLTHGQCLRNCPKGYYKVNKKKCQACHPSCVECDGPDHDNCLSCLHGMTLVSGQCEGTGQCLDRRYLNLDSICQECHSSCEICHLDVSGKGSLCTNCRDQSQIPFGRRCYEKCPSGSFPSDGICYSCQERCKECDDSGTCIQCLHPFLMSDGHCVMGCGHGKYSLKGLCHDCSEECIECEDRNICLSCKSSNMLQNGKCVSNCGVEYIARPHIRLCERNNLPPKIDVRRPLTVTESSMVDITEEAINVSDPDTAMKYLTVIVENTPYFGQMIKADIIGNILLSEGDEFFINDLKRGKIRYIQTSHSLTYADTISIKAFDGQLYSKSMNIPIRIQSEDRMQLITLESLMAKAGTETLLNVETMNVKPCAQCNSDKVIFSIVNGPSYGYFLNRGKGKSVQLFSLSDLKKDLVVYINHGNESRGDMARIRVEDEFHDFYLILTIKVMAKTSLLPIIMTSTGGQVTRGRLLNINKNMLETKVQNKMNVQTPEAVYTLLPIEGNPKNGEVLILLPVPEDGPSQGWEVTDNGMMAARISQFTQHDIDAGHIYYRHSVIDRDSLKDTIYFQVSDTDDPPNILKDQTFNIQIIAEDVLSLSHPTLAPGVQLGMTVFENQIVPITSTHMSFQDDDTPSVDLIYKLITLLSSYEGTIERIDLPYAHVVQFTQDDINNNRIIYRPPQDKMGRDPIQVSFSFIVTDGQRTQGLQEHVFTIKVIPVNNNPPHFTNPVLNVSVIEKQHILISATMLEVVDADSSLEVLQMTLTDAPSDGMIEKMLNGTTVVLRSGDKFSYRDIQKGKFQYSHTGGIDPPHDSARFSVSDGVHQTNATINFLIIKVDKSAPQMLSTASCEFNVTEGTYVSITRNEIVFSDSDDRDEDIEIVLAKETIHGYFIKNNIKINIGEGFSQRDINQGIIKFKAVKEIGSKPLTELLYFNVSDSSGNTLHDQIISVTVLPVDNLPPVISFGSLVMVEEGGEAVISSDTLHIMDIDTDVTELTIIIKKQPTFGKIHNRKPDRGSERSKKSVVRSFPVLDYIDGNIVYVNTDHKDKEAVADTFLFYVTDGKNDSPMQRFNISIQLINDEAPSIITEQLFAEEGQAVTLTNASMFAVDFDSLPEDLVFTVESMPINGFLFKKEYAMDPLDNAIILKDKSTFTYEDVLQELIIYQHDDGETTTDSVKLHLTDGDFTDSKTINIVVGLVSDETPRVKINRGLRVKAGSNVALTWRDLRATDLDSEDDDIQYTIMMDPTAGRLLFDNKEVKYIFTATTNARTFKQKDINYGHIYYSHSVGELAGNILFKFKLSDPEGNELIDQDFFITVLEDRLLPIEVNNKELSVTEGHTVKLTTDFLSFTDYDSEPGLLTYVILDGPQLGHLELTGQPGVPIVTFTQSHLAANAVMYMHTSPEEQYMDKFIFSVTDGRNELMSSFYIKIKPVDDALPSVINKGLRVQEGVRKLITEFDLKALDQDTKEQFITFTIIDPPVHGSLDILTGDIYRDVTSFTMQDIYENQVSYKHDGSETAFDSFTFTVDDGTNQVFTMQQDEPLKTPISTPQDFEITVLPMDDGMPVLDVNLGLQYLDMIDGQISNVISAMELLTNDEDTSPEEIIYTVTGPPKFGILESLVDPGVNKLSFSQEEINQALVYYNLVNKTDLFRDSFVFSVSDSKPNVIPDNTFHIMWSEISLAASSFNVSEKDGVIQVPIVRRGNLKQYSVVQCSTSIGSAVSDNVDGLSDFVHMTGQVQFDEWQELQTFNILINDDTVYEGEESFFVHISSPSYAVLSGIQRASVTIQDKEDEPVLQFSNEVIQVNETDGIIRAKIERSGDVRHSLSVVCFTNALTATGSSLKGLESGSDYISRGKSNAFRVSLLSGMTEAYCDVKLLDDSEYEATEQFEVKLSQPTMPATLGPIHTLIVIIEGPNDESFIYLSEEEFSFPENSGTVEIAIKRDGTDLSHVSTVWCSTRLSPTPSARPGQDYIPSSTQITFGPGQSVQYCSLTLLDDEFEPKLEGNETFQVFLSSTIGSNLRKPIQADVLIFDDSLDLPRMSFAQDSYTVDEKNKTLNVSIVRQGDVSLVSSVICYTRQQTAHVEDDYKERTFTNTSRVIFRPYEKVKSCLVHIVDDTSFEVNEVFFIKIGLPEGAEDSGAVIGDLHTMTITITDKDDVPRFQFQEAAYSINEPSVVDQVATITLQVIRLGAVNGTAWVRCSTRDGSAVSGVDYNAKSIVLKFEPGQQMVDFAIDILYNSDLEWHESFNVQLGPEISMGTQIGALGVAIVTILDNEVSGSLVLPAPPVVVSLLHRGDIEMGIKVNPSPGYPLVCITPCDAQHPAYSSTNSLCKESQINNSAIIYSWEVAMPPEKDGISPLFVPITDQTVFTFTDKKVLDSIYFRSFFRVRCVAQPQQENGNPGIPIKSLPVTIGHTNPICKAPSIPSNSAYSYQAQSFLARLEYVGPGDEKHPNTLHIFVQIPHQDGMLPLISTRPLHNLRLLLSNSVYRQQHICSNIIQRDEIMPLLGEAFLDEGKQDNLTFPHGPGMDFPHQFDVSSRTKETLLLYKHLNLKSCKWEFEAWYHMTELVDLCGGHVLSDFQVKDKSLTHLTVRVPLYVSYVFVTAPRGWSSMEHHSDMEFSFYYSTVLWSSGLETEERQGGRLQVVRILIGDDGKLVIEFRTHAKFRGLFVMNHHSLPDVTSSVNPPKSLTISFELELVWSQATFDGPLQMWKAKSNFNLKDYTGVYNVDLIPCLVSPNQKFVQTDPILCAAKYPERFEIPISFQQTNRPVPVLYSLNTEFQLGNNLDIFLSSPGVQEERENEWDFNGAFSNGQRLYGRVLWHPNQDLKDGYQLTLDKVFLCTGRNGYIPTFDPTGEIYLEGPQYGCLQPSTQLLYRFIILDGESPEDQNSHFQHVPFNAVLAGQDEQFSAMRTMPGVDGFAMDVDPLYKVDSGHEWYLQVVYTIGISDTSKYRQRRSLRRVTSKQLLEGNMPNKKTQFSYHIPTSQNWFHGNREKREAKKSQSHIWEEKYSSVSSNTNNGTNMQLVHLVFQTSSNSSSLFLSPFFYVPSLIFSLLLLFLIIVCIRKRVKYKKRGKDYPPAFINNFIEGKNNPRNVARVKGRVHVKGLDGYGESKNLLSPLKKCNLKKADQINVNKQDKTGTEV